MNEPCSRKMGLGPTIMHYTKQETHYMSLKSILPKN